MVTDLYPQPAGKATDLYPTVTVGILSEGRDSDVIPSSILLFQDGALLTGNPNLFIDTSFVHKPGNEGGFPTTFAGATVYYTNTTLFPPGTKHTNEIVFLDDAIPPALHTNIWSWTTAYPYAYATNGLPLGSLTVPGFDARLVHSSAANIDGTLAASPANSINNLVASAQGVLAGQFAVDLTSTNYVQVVAYGLAGNEPGGVITNFPGLCLNPPSPWSVSFAVQVLAYLQLSAGTNLFYLSHDDRVGIYSGTNLTDTSSVVMENIGSPTESPYFTVVAESAGLYPFNLVYEQGGGGAIFVLSSVDSLGNKHLVNTDLGSGGIPAFYPLVVKSATAVKGPYAADATANAGNVLAPIASNVACDGSGTMLNVSLTGGTVTVPLPSAPKFYRLDGPRASKITSIQKSGANLVISYTYQ
jgi:hypothetical protein